MNIVKHFCMLMVYRCYIYNVSRCGVMVNMLSLSVVDHGFIGGVMVSMLSSSVIDHGFISGVMVNMLS